MSNDKLPYLLSSVEHTRSTKEGGGEAPFFFSKFLKDAHPFQAQRISKLKFTEVPAKKADRSFCLSNCISNINGVDTFLDAKNHRVDTYVPMYIIIKW